MTDSSKLLFKPQEAQPTTTAKTTDDLLKMTAKKSIRKVCSNPQSTQNAKPMKNLHSHDVSIISIDSDTASMEREPLHSKNSFNFLVHVGDSNVGDSTAHLYSAKHSNQTKPQQTSNVQFASNYHTTHKHYSASNIYNSKPKFNISAASSELASEASKAQLSRAPSQYKSSTAIDNTLMHAIKTHSFGNIVNEPASSAIDHRHTDRLYGSLSASGAGTQHGSNTSTMEILNISALPKLPRNPTYGHFNAQIPSPAMNSGSLIGRKRSYSSMSTSDQNSDEVSLLPGFGQYSRAGVTPRKMARLSAAAVALASNSSESESFEGSKNAGKNSIPNVSFATLALQHNLQQRKIQQLSNSQSHSSTITPTNASIFAINARTQPKNVAMPKLECAESEQTQDHSEEGSETESVSDAENIKSARITTGAEEEERLSGKVLSSKSKEGSTSQRNKLKLNENQSQSQPTIMTAAIVNAHTNANIHNISNAPNVSASATAMYVTSQPNPSSIHTQKHKTKKPFATLPTNSNQAQTPSQQSNHHVHSQPSHAPQPSGPASAAVSKYQQLKAISFHYPFALWSVAKVQQWLNSFVVGMRYAEQFEKIQVTGQTLLGMNDNYLANVIGISDALHRREILQRIASMTQYTAYRRYLFQCFYCNDFFGCKDDLVNHIHLAHNIVFMPKQGMSHIPNIDYDPTNATVLNINSVNNVKNEQGDQKHPMTISVATATSPSASKLFKPDIATSRQAGFSIGVGTDTSNVAASSASSSGSTSKHTDTVQTPHNTQFTVQNLPSLNMPSLSGSGLHDGSDTVPNLDVSFKIDNSGVPKLDTKFSTGDNHTISSKSSGNHAMRVNSVGSLNNMKIGNISNGTDRNLTFTFNINSNSAASTSNTKTHISTNNESVEGINLSKIKLGPDGKLRHLPNRKECPVCHRILSSSNYCRVHCQKMHGIQIYYVSSRMASAASSLLSNSGSLEGTDTMNVGGGTSGSQNNGDVNDNAVSRSDNGKHTKRSANSTDTNTGSSSASHRHRKSDRAETSSSSGARGRRSRHRSQRDGRSHRHSRQKSDESFEPGDKAKPPSRDQNDSSRRRAIRRTRRELTKSSTRDAGSQLMENLKTQLKSQGDSSAGGGSGTDKKIDNSSLLRAMIGGRVDMNAVNELAQGIVNTQFDRQGGSEKDANKRNFHVKQLSTHDSHKKISCQECGQVVNSQLDLLAHTVLEHVN